MKAWIQHIEGDFSPLVLSTTALASGGEGSLYTIQSPKGYQHLVAKIYHPNKRTTLRYNKIKYLQKYPPKALSDHWNTQLIWPQELLFDKHHNFIGFLMPKAKGDKLELLCLPQIPKKFQKKWQEFDFLADPSLQPRLNICYKIAAAIHQIHQTERYILVDMKPDNIMVDSDGSVALVDLDSVEVVEEGETIYDAPVATPEYTPPDSYLKEQLVDPTQEDPWDRFGLGVIFYKMLIGVHPFAASAFAPYDQYTSLYQKIEHGMFVHNPKMRGKLSVVPALHDRFDQLPPNIQRLFIRCFVDGHSDPFKRPSAEDWVNALREHSDHYHIKKETVEVPTISLAQFPKQLDLDKLFILPTTAPISHIPKLKLKKPLKRKEFQKHKLPTELNDPKTIRSQRFFNFLAIILITVLATIFAFLVPIGLTVSIGIIAYLGLNYITYRNRKSADRKALVVSILNNQLAFFNEMIRSAEKYEKSIANCMKQITQIYHKNPKTYISNLLNKRDLIQEKITQFNNFIETQREKLEAVKKEEKKGYAEIRAYYKTELKNKLPNTPSSNSMRQEIVLLKRSKRLNRLTPEQAANYQSTLETLTQLQLQQEIEQNDLSTRLLESSQNILYRCQKAYDDLLEEIKMYHNSVGLKEEREVKSLINDQRISLQELERLQYDLDKLEKPLNDQVNICRKAQQDALLYDKINYGRHLLEMVGILKPF